MEPLLDFIAQEDHSVGVIPLQERSMGEGDWGGGGGSADQGQFGFLLKPVALPLSCVVLGLGRSSARSADFASWLLRELNTGVC